MASATQVRSLPVQLLKGRWQVICSFWPTTRSYVPIFKDKMSDVGNRGVNYF